MREDQRLAFMESGDLPILTECENPSCKLCVIKTLRIKVTMMFEGPEGQDDECSFDVLTKPLFCSGEKDKNSIIHYTETDWYHVEVAPGRLDQWVAEQADKRRKSPRKITVDVPHSYVIAEIDLIGGRPYKITAVNPSMITKAETNGTEKESVSS